MVDQNIIDIVKQYLEIIPRELEITKVYLFGSFAKGTAKEDSDIDIAIILRNMSDFF